MYNKGAMFARLSVRLHSYVRPVLGIALAIL
jgi:hypothetical protein